MLIKKPLEPILNQKYLRKDETSDILDTFNAPMINVSAVNPIGQSGDKITLIGKIFDDEIEGRNIDFYNGSTYLGTGQTNKYGVGIFDYTCSGAGTKEIIGKLGDKTSNSILIEDWYTIGFKNTTFSKFPASQSGVNITEKTDESITFYGGGSWGSISQTILNSSDDWECSFTVLGNQVTGGGVSFGIQSDNEVSAVDGRNLKLETRDYYGRKVINLFIGGSQYGHTDMTSNPQSYDVKFVKEGTTVKGYVDGSLITTVNNLAWLNDPMHILMRTWGSTTTFYQTISNFKIKKL